MIAIGIDPGTALTGVAVLKINDNKSIPEIIDVSCVRTAPKTDMHKRLKIMHEELLEIANTHSPEIMIIERLFFNTNVKTAISVGQARGVSLLVAAQKDMYVVEYTALEAKRVLTGYGRATKKEMQEAVKEHMKLDDVVKPDDANDAIAMVLCFLNKDYAALKENGYN